MPLEQHVWRPIKMNQGKWSVGDEKTKIKRIQISSRNQRKICSVVLCSKVLRSNDICSLRYLRRLLIQAVVVRKALSTFSFLYVSKCLLDHITCAQHHSTSQSPHTILCRRQYYYPHVTNGETKSRSKVGMRIQTCCRVPPAPSHSVKWNLRIDFRLSLWKYLFMYQYGGFRRS